MNVVKLYNKLLKTIELHSLSYKNKEEIYCKKIDQIYSILSTEEQKEFKKIIMCLIIHHYVTIDNKKLKTKTLPYDGIYMDNFLGVKYENISQLPKDLLKIIFTFIDIVRLELKF